MTNLEKFIQIMNTTFDAGFTPENMVLQCSPCGRFKKFEYACRDYDCEKCSAWWNKEYSDKLLETGSKPMPVKRCIIDGAEQDVKNCTVKKWFAKINEELDEFKEATLRAAGLETYARFAVCASERQVIAEEAIDIITAITSFLEAMGIDEEQRDEAQRRVNEKNRKRGRL